jgi:hypothetical protein
LVASRCRQQWAAAACFESSHSQCMLTVKQCVPSRASHTSASSSSSCFASRCRRNGQQQQVLSQATASACQSQSVVLQAEPLSPILLPAVQEACPASNCRRHGSRLGALSCLSSNISSPGAAAACAGQKELVCLSIRQLTAKAVGMMQDRSLSPANNTLKKL